MIVFGPTNFKSMVAKEFEYLEKKLNKSENDKTSMTIYQLSTMCI